MWEELLDIIRIDFVFIAQYYNEGEKFRIRSICRIYFLMQLLFTFLANVVYIPNNRRLGDEKIRINFISGVFDGKRYTRLNEI